MNRRTRQGRRDRRNRRAAACAQMPMMGGGGSGGGADIVDVAAKNPDFSTLVTAVQTAGLTETLKGDGPFTVFAPTNAAFEKLPDGTVDSLLQPENRDKLTEILTYHVVPGTVTAGQLAGERLGVKTVQGGTVHVDGTDDHSPTGSARGRRQRHRRGYRGQQRA